MMMKTMRDSSSKLCSSLSFNLELEVAEALTQLANQSEINTPLQANSFSPSLNVESATSSLHLALCPYNQDHAVAVPQNGERGSSMTVRKRIHAGEDTEFLPNSNGGETRAKTIQDLNVVPEDYVVEGQQDSEKECHITVTEPIQTEENTEIQQNPNEGKSSAPPVSCKSRRDMKRPTQDQKETRRLRRVLANRLSARQTILKRQSRCDEFAKKAAELECENDNLKKEKEAAMRKYDILKSTNERLKAQLNMMGVTEKVEVEVVETQEGSKFNNGHTPTSTSLSTQQYYIFNQPSILPCVLPYITPGSNIVQHAPQDGIFVASQAPVLANGIISPQDGIFVASQAPLLANGIIAPQDGIFVASQAPVLANGIISPQDGIFVASQAPVLANGIIASQDGIFVASQAPVLANGINCSLLEHENPLMMNIPGNTSYALPYHWFIPPLHQADRVPPQSMDLADKLKVTYQSSFSSYPKNIAGRKKNRRLQPKLVRGEASTSTEGIRPCVRVGHGKVSGKKLAHKRKVTSEAATDSPPGGHKKTVARLRRSQNYASNRSNEVITCAAATSSSSEENPEQPVDSLIRRRMDAYSTAVARKKRKEVVKMKNFQYSRRVRISSN